MEAVERASEAGVVMLTFPPHTPHRLQPLDISVYSSLKAYYNQCVDAWLLNNPRKTLDIYSIAEIVGQAYPRAFSTSNIVSGFKNAGIFPLDRSIFKDDYFLGSYVTDRPGPTASGEIENPTVVTNSAVPTVGEMGNPTAHCHNEIGNIEELEMRPSTSVGMSTPVHFTADRNQNVVSVIITPEQLQPFPKATARKTNRQGRKLGRTKIATHTPEKIEMRKGGKKT